MILMGTGNLIQYTGAYGNQMVGNVRFEDASGNLGDHESLKWGNRLGTTETIMTDGNVT